MTLDFLFRRVAGAVLAAGAQWGRRAVALGALAWGLHGTPAAAQHAPADTAVLTRFIQSQLDKANVPGAAVVVVKGDSLVYARAFGSRTRSGAAATPETPFLIGSMSKSFTALAVLQLVEAGKLDLDAPVTRYLARLRFADGAGSEMTVRHLLNHTSGIREGDGLVPLPEPFLWDDAPFSRIRLQSAPGSAFDYSNLNYTLLGLLVEAVSGQTFATYVQQHIAAPLGLAHTSAEKGAFGDGLAQGHQFWYGPALQREEAFRQAAIPAGFIAASARDLGRFLAAHVDTAGARVRLGLSPALLEASRTPWNGDALGYGMGWRRAEWNGQPIVQHTGLVGTFSSAMLYLPETGYGIAVLTDANTFSGNSLLARGTLAWLDGQTPRAERPAEVWWRLGAFAGLLLSAYGAGRAAYRWNREGRPLETPAGGKAWGALVWDVGVPVALLVGIPHVFDTPLHMMLKAQPDLGYALVVGAALSMTGGALKAVTPR